MAKYCSPFAAPVRCTAGYPNYPSGKPHGGEDYVPTDKTVESNWKLYAVTGAKVYISKKQSGSYPGGYGAYGNYIVYQCDSGYWILMAHMRERPAPKAGDRIEKGTYIGVAGQTGNAQGRHLHIEVADMRGVPYTSSNWYELFKKHRVKPSDYINFDDLNPGGTGGFDVKTWTNGSTTEKVFQTTTDCKVQKNPIGSLAPRESCDCYGIIDGVYLVSYRVNGTSSKKCGFVKYSGGVKA
jgi:hypothetical protein